MSSQLHISAREYRRMMSEQGGFSTKKNIIKKEKKDPLKDVHYTYNVEFKKNTIIVTLLGKHFSKNVTNSMSLKDVMRFKTKLKDASYNFFLLNPKMKKFCQRWECVAIHYDIYNPRSRDTHNTDLKTFRDTFTNVGIIKDDNRTIIPFPPTEKETISKEYKIVATIRKLDTTGMKAQQIRHKIYNDIALLSDDVCLTLDNFAKENAVDIGHALTSAIKNSGVIKQVHKG